ncbi:DUF2867 domain-containing protein [Streptomyces sp. SP17BM10]|uniref:DUF2867 domain-containing protein n=1 Tax=Streptomyces sp. SP17BM10 TaxID=3002530 RepID=UPI002E7A5F24|nr:DUF2867 domain-containing protein [Streptomyces sp. SP17BM10]MEE1782355.1 DUF2867 domain-containing protein [Streptomyces sp. SP17BM10]
MRLPSTAHTSRPWRIHGIAPDFRVEDVWALPTPGGPDDLPHLVGQFTEGEEPGMAGSSFAYRTLFAVRRRLGRLLHLDDADGGVGGRVASLRDRLPADLLAAPRGPDSDALPFRSVYLLHDEWAAELANRTVHAVLHLGWVPDGAGGYRGQMAVLVKPNGLLGAAYLLGIKPFRYVVVYPGLLRSIGRRWQETAGRRK